MSGYQRMKEEEQRLEKEIRQLLEQAQQTDEAEDELYGPDNRGDELRRTRDAGLLKRELLGAVSA